jgi:hypothetical protein
VSDSVYGMELVIEAQRKEIERLRGLVRTAFSAGFMAWAGPANDAEYKAAVEGEKESWGEWSRAFEQQAPPTPGCNNS